MANLNLKGTPSQKQLLFFDSKKLYTAYGGARGGGKSWALRRKLILMALRYPEIRLLLIRRSYSELRENHTLHLLTEIGSITKYNDSEKSMTFPNGSRLKLGYCDTESDVLQYQGQEYDVIAMDEATQFTEYQFDCLRSCLRGGEENHPKRIYLTCNPGGVGHGWVKRLFIDKTYHMGENTDDYSFIQALADDNPHNGKQYIAMLESLPNELKQAWRYGRWDVFAGQYFSEWDENIHICEPKELKPYWRKYMAVDYGLDMLAALWIAVDEFGFAYIYRELYQSGLIVSQAAEAIKKAEQHEPLGARITRYAPPDLWNRQKDTGKSIIDIFHEKGIHFMRADNNRENGFLCVKEWLNPVENQGKKVSRLRIFKGAAPNLIRCLPILQFDSKNTNDCANEPHEITHSPDALRYFCIMMPKAATNPKGMLTNKTDPVMEAILGV